MSYDHTVAEFPFCEAARKGGRKTGNVLIRSSVKTDTVRFGREQVYSIVRLDNRLDRAQSQSRLTEGKFLSTCPFRRGISSHPMLPRRNHAIEGYAEGFHVTPWYLLP